MTTDQIIELAKDCLRKGDGLTAKALYFVAGSKFAKDERYAATLLDEAGQKMKERVDNLEQSANAKLN